MSGDRDDSDDEVIGQGRYLRLCVRSLAETQRALFEGQAPHGWEYVTRHGSRGVVVIVAISDAGELVLVEQHRPPVGCSVIELPAGLVGDQPGHADEALEDAARRELLEETGYAASRMEHLASGPSSAGLTDEIVTFFLAHELERVDDGGGDASESITVHRVRLPELRTWLGAQAQRGALVEPKIYSALFLAGLEA